MVGGRRNDALNSYRSGRSYQLHVFVIVLGLVISVFLLIALNSKGSPVLEDSIHDHVSESTKSSLVSIPTMEFVYGTEIIWQIPTDPIAVLFIAHGCGGTALNFWDESSTCQKCVGLPEEKRIVEYALAQNFGVLTLTSSDTCWSAEEERLRVAKIIKWWVDKNNLMKVPLFGLGASAGGYFLSVLATEVKFRGIVLMIASGLFDRMNNIPDDYPSILFVHMPKDIKRARKVDRHIELLKKKGIETKEIKCMGFALTPNWLADTVPGLDKPTSLKVFELLCERSFIDAKGFMRKDGRAIPLREALKQSDIVLPFGSRSIYHIEEELNLAYGYYEMTSLQSDQMFEWLKSHIS